jgi:Protein of unknown function DUF262
MSTPHTFWQLLCKYKIHIPIIQRDYAQGRSDDRAIDIRTSLLENIRETFVQDKKLHFDFIYGSIKDDVLSPLDGQQRLTTLFLIHWYIAVKEEIDVHQTLVKFSYSTRISARDFCEQLALEPLTKEELVSINVSSVIKNKKWFQFHWETDPTVNGMLTMLDAIHSAFFNLDGYVMERLMSDCCPVTFSFLELERFGLGDELYIKMNSRGKPLTIFENFKAQFELILESNGFLYESKQFSLNVEQGWTELLWAYREKDYTIDNAFMRLFTFISSALYLKEHPSVRSNFIFTSDFSRVNDLQKVYSKKENVDFLFECLSLWKNKEDVYIDFGKIFTELPLFNNTKQLFDKCINNTLQLDERVLLYTIFAKKIAGQDSDLIDTLRVVRNLLNRIRQGNYGVYNSNLRVEIIGQILRTIDRLIEVNKPIYDTLIEVNNTPGFANKSLMHEKEKALLILEKPHLKVPLHQLEDHPRLKGAIHQWLDVFLKYPDQLHDVLLGIDIMDPSLVSRAMLSLEDYSLRIGYSNLGPRYLFGGGISNCEFLWTHTEGELSSFFTGFITEIINADGSTIKEKISSLVNPDKLWSPKEDWEYYFIKYKGMIKKHHQIFTFSGETPSDIERLSGINLQSLHINPFYEAIVELIDDDTICSLSDCKTRFSERSEIRMKNGTVFKLKSFNWIYEVEPEIQSELDQYYKTLGSYDLIEQGYALVLKASELKRNFITH